MIFRPLRPNIIIPRSPVLGGGLVKPHSENRGAAGPSLILDKYDFKAIAGPTDPITDTVDIGTADSARFCALANWSSNGVLGSTCSVAGTSLTQLDTYLNAYRIEMWGGFVTSGSGNQTVSLDYTGTPNHFAGWHLWVFQNATVGFQDYDSTNINTYPNYNVNVLAGDYVVGLCYYNGAGGTWNGDETPTEDPDTWYDTAMAAHVLTTMDDSSFGMCPDANRMTIIASVR